MWEESGRSNYGSKGIDYYASNSISFEDARNVIESGYPKPSYISQGRWGAIVKQVKNNS